MAAELIHGRAGARPSNVSPEPQQTKPEVERPRRDHELLRHLVQLPAGVVTCVKPQQRRYLSISKRTLADWQVRRIIGHRKIRGAVCFKITELDAALEKFKIKAVS